MTDATPPYGTPDPPAGAAGPVVARIGELAVTSTSVGTPAGEIPLHGSDWQVSEHWLAEQRTPTWAILLAIFGFCLLTVFSLLFLLVKQTVYHGTVEITVSNGPRRYVGRIPVRSQAEAAYVYQQVNYVRSLAAL